jgi:hypothetical protein
MASRSADRGGLLDHVPAFTRSTSATQVVTSQLSAFARVENVGNVLAVERDNLTTPMDGSVLGVRLQY